MAAIAKRILIEAGLWTPAAFPGAEPFYEGSDKENALKAFMRSTHPEKILFVLDHLDALGPHLHVFVQSLPDDAEHLNWFHTRFVNHSAFYALALQTATAKRQRALLSFLNECIRLWLSTASQAMLSHEKWGDRSSHPMLKLDKIDGILRMFPRFFKSIAPCHELEELRVLEHRLIHWRNHIATL